MISWFKKQLKQPAAYDGPSVETGQFGLKLSQEWKQDPTDDPEQFSFIAKDGSVLTLSCMLWEMSADRLPEAADVLLKSRMKALAEGLGGHRYELTEVKFVPVPYPGVEIYAGGGASGISYFSRFYGLLTEQFAINLYVESPASSASNNEARFNAVLEGFQVKVATSQTAHLTPKDQ